MSSPPLKFLVTGASGGLGGSVLDTLYKNVSDPSTIAAASSRPEASAKLQQAYPGIQFRVVDYDDATSLVHAFQGVERLFFVSSPEPNSDKREVQHENVVRAAKEAGVGRVYYSSLAFGGYERHSVVSVQRAHIFTEKLLEESGIPHISVREGVYTDAFPVFIFWYPDTTTVYLTGDGPVAFSSRAELGEATARLMLRDPSSIPTHLVKNNTVLLTANKTYTLTNVVNAISEATGTNIAIKHVSREEYPDIMAAEDAKPGHGNKSRAFFEVWMSLVDGIERGEAKTTSPLMKELLGREPRDAMEHVKQLVRDAAPHGGYTWHQNNMKR
ncbi:hypothetical protein VTO42DRAFT_7569 [Malbranchea cinnamomea]